MAAELIVGAMNFGQRTSEAESLRILERAIAAGIRSLDTANVYTDGKSETIVGKFLARVGTTCHVATKVGLARPKGRVEGLSRATVLDACARSRERLGIERIDLYYLHAPDPSTPIEETLEALAILKQQAAIDAWGVSNFSSWQILEMIHRAPQFDLSPPYASQVIYNLLVRQIDIEHLAFAQRYGLNVITYNPLAGGLLVGGRTLNEKPASGSRFDGNTLYQRRYWNAETFRRVDAYQQLADAAQRSLLDLAYGFAFNAPGVAGVLVGPASVEHLEAAIAARERAFEGALAKQIDALHIALSGGDARYAR